MMDFPRRRVSLDFPKGINYVVETRPFDNPYQLDISSVLHNILILTRHYMYFSVWTSRQDTRQDTMRLYPTM